MFRKYKIGDYNNMRQIEIDDAIRLERIRRGRIDWFFEYGIPFIVLFISIISIIIVMLL